MADERVLRIRRLIDGLRWDRRQHPYAARREYATRVADVASRIRALIGDGRARDAVPLARRAVDLVTSALMYLDDSSGVISVHLSELMDLYAGACTLAPPDAKRLAAWLFGVRVDGPGWPDIRLEAFAAALGVRGLAELERLVAERRPAEADESLPGGGLRDLREQLAAVSGDVDAYVSVLAEDLRGTYRYSRIVTALRTAGRDTDAERWARDGLARDATGRQADELRDVLVDLLLDHDRNEEAIAERRATFERRTIRTDYLDLRRTAEKTGDWPGLRGWALSVIRGRAEVDRRYVPELLAILLEENRNDEAWTTAISHRDDVGESRWYELIERREIAHPRDVLPIYEHLVELRLAQSQDKYRYAKAVKTITRLGDAYRRAGDDGGFAAYLTDLCDRHKRKTAFLAKLDKTGL